MAEVKKTPSVKKRVILGLATVVYVLICSELIVRGVSYFKDIYNIEMLKYAVNLKEPSDVEGLSHKHIENSDAHLMGVDVKLNSDGNRSPELSDPKAANEIRLYFLGSSITMGWGVEQEESFPARVTAKLNEKLGERLDKQFVEINGGVGNYNSVLQVAKFKQQFDSIQPDIAVMQYYINDVEDVSARDNPIVRYSYLAAFLYPYIKAAFNSRGQTLGEYYEALYQSDSPGWLQAQAAIADLKEFTDARDVQLVTILVPEVHDLRPAGIYPALYTKIERVFNDLGVDFINSLEAVREVVGNVPSRGWVARDDPHPSALVHQALANELVEYLSDESIVMNSMK
jgi:hypothetical protein